jgi:hypothetical protein
MKPCTRRFFGHKWKTHYLNSGLYHHGAIGRKGELCEHCLAKRFPESDAEFWAKLPAWLREEIADQNPTLKSI